jgi:hypothetical protein
VAFSVPSRAELEATIETFRSREWHCRRGLRKVTLHALMGLVTMQAAAVVRAEAGEVERVREVSRRVA